MNIAIANRQRHVPLDRPMLRSLCRHILDAHRVEANLSLCYVDDAAIRTLNARHLARDEPTDVLAFPFDVAQPPPAVRGPTTCHNRPRLPGLSRERLSHNAVDPEERLLGEIVVSAETALTQAARRHIPVARELALYTAHGLLHLLGYGDHTPAERRAMRRAERQALAAIGL